MGTTETTSNDTAAGAWTLVAVIGTIAAAALALAITAIIIGRDGGASALPATRVAVSLSEFAIELDVAVPAGQVVFDVVNDGAVVHNLSVRETGDVTPDLATGERAALDVGSLEPGTYELFCSIPGHVEAGMATEVIVGDDESSATAGHAGHDAADGAARDQAMIDSMLAFPAATEGVGNVPLEPEVLPDGTKRFELTAAITEWEVAPGEIVDAWTYNGIVPGPRIDLDVGDDVEVVLTNELPVGTDIHWHGIDLPNDQDGVAPLTQDLIASGETYTYRFTVTEAAIGMYHAHTHAQVAVPNGMFGTMYVGDVPMPEGETVSGIDIPADLELALDIPMVLNDAGVIGLTLDGKSFPATAPVLAEVGDWMRVTYFNEGLQVHPMHLHGFEQIVVAKDGEPLDHPYAADTVLVGPGERYTVLVSPDRPGVWVWHCHILNHVESADGVFGMVTAMIVE